MPALSPELTGIEALIFDLDGTMVHTLGDFQVAIQRTLADLDLPAVSPALIEQAIGKGSEHLIRTLLTHQLARPEVKGLGKLAQPCRSMPCLNALGCAISTTTESSMVNSPMFIRAC